MKPICNVLSVKPSPLNHLQWNVSLDCGHDVWITRRSRPSLKKLRCEKCEARPPAKEPLGKQSEGQG
jgi:hypothetical protein